MCSVLVLPLCGGCGSSPASFLLLQGLRLPRFCGAAVTDVPRLPLAKPSLCCSLVFGCKGTIVGFWSFPAVITFIIPFFMPWLKTSVVGKFYCAWSEYCEFLKTLCPEEGQRAWWWNVFLLFLQLAVALGSAANWFSLGQCHHPGINSWKWEGNSELRAGCLHFLVGCAKALLLISVFE